MTVVMAGSPPAAHPEGMKALRVVLVILSAVLLAAHFFRSGALVPAGLSLALPLLLAWKHDLSVWLLRGSLVLGAVEWTRTAVLIAERRVQWGQPWHRMACILGAVAVVTLASAWTVRGARRPDLP